VKARILLLASCVSLLLGGLAVDAGAKNQKVYFPSNCTNTRFKPTHLVAACGDAGLRVNGIQWSHYGAKTATGSGTAAINTCMPDCASGSIAHGPAVVKLKRPKLCANVDRTVFTRLKVTYGGNTVTFPFPCSALE